MKASHLPTELLKCTLILCDIYPALFPEDLGKVLHYALIEVLAPQVSVAL